MSKLLFATTLLLLAGCQHLSPMGLMSYHGKELPPGYFEHHYDHQKSTGHEYRGYHKVTRHFF